MVALVSIPAESGVIHINGDDWSTGGTASPFPLNQGSFTSVVKNKEGGMFFVSIPAESGVIHIRQVRRCNGSGTGLHSR